MEFIRKIFNSYSLILVIVLLGLFAIILSIWGEFENSLWKDTWGTIGKTILVSSVFAGMLKLMQISGVFMEELEKLIFEPKFLKNRKDIDSYWGKVSKELFKHKFPQINGKILTDIKDMYFPTTEIIYYDKAEHFMEISLEEDGRIKVTQNMSLSIVCSNKQDSFDYKFANSMDVVNSKDEVEFISNFIKVNGAAATNVSHITKLEESIEGKKVKNEFSLTLKGASKYDIEREEVKKYSLEKDDLLYFRAAKLTNTLTVTVNHSQALSVKFFKMGELDEFVTKQHTKTLKKYEYKGLIYKNQGYILQFKKNPTP